MNNLRVSAPAVCHINLSLLAIQTLQAVGLPLSLCERVERVVESTDASTNAGVPITIASLLDVVAPLEAIECSRRPWRLGEVVGTVVGELQEEVRRLRAHNSELEDKLEDACADIDFETLV